MVHVMPYTLPIIKVPFQICFISKDVILKSVTKVDNHLVTANLFFTIRSTPVVNLGATSLQPIDFDEQL